MLLKTPKVKADTIRTASKRLFINLKFCGKLGIISKNAKQIHPLGI
jgi:hypothetical protein